MTASLYQCGSGELLVDPLKFFETISSIEWGTWRFHTPSGTNDQ